MENELLPLNQLRKIRIEKLNKLKQLGINPFVSKAVKDYQISQIKNEYEKYENSEMTLSGRLMSLREHGELVFADLEDTTGRIQIYIKHEGLTPHDDELKNIGFDELGLLDIGDFVQVTGIITKTKRGEISIAPGIIKLLTKTIRPLPSQHFGLKDEEERYRQRYVDFILNPDVREMFNKKSKFWNSMRNFLVADRKSVV